MGLLTITQNLALGDADDFLDWLSSYPFAP